MNDFDWSYIGAFIDGEGCIMSSIRPNKNGTFSVTPRITIQLRKSDDWLLYDLSEFLKTENIRSSLNTFDYTWRRDKGSEVEDMTMLSITERKCTKDFLLKVRPHLKLKVKACDVLLKIIDILDRRRNRITKRDILDVALLRDTVTKSKMYCYDNLVKMMGVDNKLSEFV